MTHLVARADRDPHLGARIVRRLPLRFSPAADPHDPERPAHVRAASGLAWWGGRLVAVQDDALWLVRIDPGSGSCQALALPPFPGAEEARLFDEGRGNKRRKPDLEACLVGGEEAGLLIGLGSGSTPAREQLLVLPLQPGAAARWVAAPALYARLRAVPAFAGLGLNLEGAALLPGGGLRLFQRGNGAPREGVRPWSATCDLPAAPLLAALQQGQAPPGLEPARVLRWELGELGGVPLGFTDAAPGPGGRVAFLAAAEDSADAVEDGGVTGSALGVIDAEGAGRWAPLGEAPLKAEGLALDPRDPARAWVVLDPDDPERPADLLEVALDGPWWGEADPPGRRVSGGAR